MSKLKPKSKNCVKSSIRICMQQTMRILMHRNWKQSPKMRPISPTRTTISPKTHPKHTGVGAMMQFVEGWMMERRIFLVVTMKAMTTKMKMAMANQ